MSSLRTSRASTLGCWYAARGTTNVGCGERVERTGSGVLIAAVYDLIMRGTSSCFPQIRTLPQFDRRRGDGQLSFGSSLFLFLSLSCFCKLRKPIPLPLQLSGRSTIQLDSQGYHYVASLSRACPPPSTNTRRVKWLQHASFLQPSCFPPPTQTRWVSSEKRPSLKTTMFTPSRIQV